uniref:Cathepsin L-like proteinase n=1 Tax=Aceria tosichella TaxID=561515 RepID=A0A6G1SGN7_9ACAR
MVVTKGKFLIIILAIVLATNLTESQEFPSNTNGKNNEVVPPNQGSSSGGILNLLLTPIKATYNGAKKLFGYPVNEAVDFAIDSVDEIRLQTFRLFMKAYNKSYDSPAELKRRMNIFFERRKMIEQSVRDYAAGVISYIMRENAFTDRTDEELKALTRSSPPSEQEMTDDEREAILLGQYQPGDLDNELVVHSSISGVYNDDEDERNMTVMAPEPIPDRKDWRESGCVAPPMDQQACGACYAIATTNTIESMRCIFSRDSSPLLSPQQVIDCSTPRAGYQNHGCDGGWPTRVLKYLQDVGVVTRDACYPFVRRQDYCQLRKVRAMQGCTLNASPTDTRLRYKILNNERDILYHVARTGPVITVMKALDSFLFYSRGIYDERRCSRNRDDVDHAIAIVGYGSENGKDYWIIKNSWGTEDWGEGGFGRYRRGTRTCSLGGWGWAITS